MYFWKYEDASVIDILDDEPKKNLRVKLYSGPKRLKGKPGELHKSTEAKRCSDFIT